MSFHLFETPVISPHTIALTLMVQIAVKDGINKHNSLVSPCFSGNAVILPPYFWIPRFRCWFRAREKDYREGSTSQSRFWEECQCRFPSSSHFCLAGEILRVFCDLCPAKSSLVHISTLVCVVHLAFMLETWSLSSLLSLKLSLPCSHGCIPLIRVNRPLVTCL